MREFYYVGLILFSVKFLICASLPDEATLFCYEENKGNKCEPTSVNFTITDKNETDGTATFTFDYKPSCSYNLTVDFAENTSEKECNVNAKKTSYSEYSYSGISEKNEGLLRCTEKGVIKLKYLRQGCFIFQLANINSRTVATQALYLAGPEKYNFQDFVTDDSFFVDNSGLNSRTCIEITHPFVKLNPTLRLIVGTNKAISLRQYYEPEKNNNSSEVQKYTNSTTNENDFTVDCGRTNNTIKCFITGLPTENYSFTYTLSNIILCCKNSIILPKCEESTAPIYIQHARDITTVRPALASTPYTIPNYLSYTIFCAVVSLGVILIIIIFVYIKYKRANHYEREFLKNSNIDKQNLIEDQKLLLLYARDADVVMNTMKAFRNALVAKGFKVFDVFDEDEQKFINEDNEKWIFNKLSQKDMKIVIVRTYCGRILANHPDAHKLYKKPECYDHIFPYALSCIRGRIDLTNSKKLVIVTMGFEEIKYNDYILDSSTKYAVPDNFKLLVRNLLETNQENCSIDMCHKNNEFNEFKNMYNQMEEYIENVDYINEIMNASVTYNYKEIEEPLETTIRGERYKFPVFFISCFRKNLTE